MVRQREELEYGPGGQVRESFQEADLGGQLLLVIAREQAVVVVFVKD